MPNSRRWSNVSAPCRLELSASRAKAACLLALGVLAGVACLASECPRPLAAMLAAFALLHGAWSARRESRRPACALVIPAGESAPTVDGKPVTELRLQWRGSIAYLQWRDESGRCQRADGWPDALDQAARRELRLAVAARAPRRTPRSVAP